MPLGPVALAAMLVGGCVDSPHGDRGPTGSQRSTDAPRRTATAPANGFGDAIAWRGLDEGLAEARQLARPLMLVVHASWCSQCRALKPEFGDDELEALSEKFVMVNVDQDQVPRALEFAPDGDYVPRIVFVDPKSGRPVPELLNEQRSRTVYYYSSADDVVDTMKKALERNAG
jgi:thiol-disulfide isomerase/thioredoxin